MKTFKLILSAGLLLTTSQLLSQSDTIFLNDNWIKTEKNNAKYYRLIVEKEGNLFDVKDYFMNGVLQMTGRYSSFTPEIRVGNFQYFNPNGTISMEGVFVEDAQEGIWKNYDTLGKLNKIESFRNGKLHGDFTTYYSSGAIRRKEIHEEGKFISGKCFDEKGTEIDFFPYDQPAEFRGGKHAMMRYLSDNIIYPEKARKKRIQGKIWLRFVVSEGGTVGEIRIIRGVHPLLDAEAVYVVSHMPNWNPGKIDGVPVKSYFDLPINFTLRR